MSAIRRLNHQDHSYYEQIRSINGQHPFKDRIPDGYVEYRARTRKNGKVVYFNFELAKEMGLISKEHPHKMNSELQQTLLDTFAIQIINEYDISHKKVFPESELKKNTYMATRYLQLQHPSKVGKTSGDGRSIWNGVFTSRGTTWDVTSCGTGATRLSPATAINKKFYRTGDPSVSYGCGYSDVYEGVGNGIFSEIFHRNGIRTERTLLVIEFPRGFSINVRAGRNLLRPSHMFNHLKQENLQSLKATMDYYIDRQISNGDLPASSGPSKYKQALESITKTFAEISAKFEAEYIFCWLDWDGDNILCDGGIIDYGSIRQFGLFHHEYRFDDVERWSTTLVEQKTKARYIIQNFIQICDYIITGKKKPIQHFRRHHMLRFFDKYLDKCRLKFRLEKLGLTDKQVNFLVSKKNKLARAFEKNFNYFERATTSRGQERIEDGITTNAIFCMRDALRELPRIFSVRPQPMSTEAFIDIIRSSYASKNDLRINVSRKKQAKELQKNYLKIVNEIAKFEKNSTTSILNQLQSRSAIINRYERITGDAMLHVADKLLRTRKSMEGSALQTLIEQFIDEQILIPGKRSKALRPVKTTKNKAEKILNSLQKIVKAYREGL